MPLLLLYLFSLPTQLNTTLIMALVFGFLGDVFLIFSNNYFFISGLVCFLIGHLWYVVELSSKITSIEISNLLVLVTIFIMIVVFLLYKSLSKGLGNLKIPVIFYIITIFSMFYLSIVLFIGQPSYKSALTLLGALLFVISDYSLAFSLFKRSFFNKDLLIMSTYILAQFLLVIGLL